MITAEHKLLIQVSFEKLIPVSQRATRLFYTRLFELDPSIKPLFSHSLDKQERNFMIMLRSMVKSLEHLEEVPSAIAALGQRHIGYGTEERDYATVGKALLWALATALGTAFTHETEVAWDELYKLLAEVMKEAALKAV